MSWITIWQSAFLASNLESILIWCEVMYINIIFTYIKCSFELKYMAAVCTGISDYVMEKLFNFV